MGGNGRIGGGKNMVEKAVAATTAATTTEGDAKATTATSGSLAVATGTAPVAEEERDTTLPR